MTSLESQIQSVADESKADTKDYLDSTPIKHRVTTLSQRCAALHRQVDERKVWQEKVVEEITTFVTVTEELHVYLGKAYDTLDNMEPIHHDADIINKQLEEVQVIAGFDVSF